MSRGTAVALVLAAALFAHWPALISDSIMWDDWIMLAWITQARADWMFQFHSNYGITPFVLADFPFVALSSSPATSIQVAKIAYLLGVSASAVLITLVSERVAHGNVPFAALAGVSAVCFPALSGEGFHISMLKYFVFIPLFLAGVLVFIRVASSAEFRLTHRLIGLLALFLSFSLNSLLTLFYALVPAVFYASARGARQGWRNLIGDSWTFVFRHADFLALPLVFWAVKEAFMPRTGMYARYNALRFDWMGVFHAYERLVPDVLQPVLFVPLSLQFAPWVAAAVFVAVVIIAGPLLLRLGNAVEITGSRLITLFGLGFVALLGAALPYYMVGRRSFQAFGFMSRDNVLFPLAVGWMTAALFCMLMKLRVPSPAPRSQGPVLWQRRVVLGGFAALIFLQSASSWRNHADWQAHYVYYRSAIEKIARDGLVRQASVIQLIDHLPGQRSLKTWKYPTSIWTEIVTAAFHDTTRLAIPLPPENGRFYGRDEISRRVRETELDFMLGGIDPGGQQIRLTVEPAGEVRSPIRLAMSYWHARFFAPDDLPGLLDSLTRIHSERIGG